MLGLRYPDAEPGAANRRVRRNLITCGFLAAACVSVGGQSRLPDVRVPRIYLPKQLPPCTVPQFIKRIEATIDRPLSFEVRPEDYGCWSQLPVRPSPLLGSDLSSVGDVLDHLLTSDQRYEWRDMDGVIVVRPTNAWRNPDHFLHRPVAAFTVADGHLAGALATISATLQPWAFGNPDFLLVATPLLPPIHTSFRGGTVLDGLNSIVASRNDLGWTVYYCTDGTGVRIHIESRGYATLVGAAPGSPQCEQQ
jgi:hypothetical protein